MSTDSITEEDIRKLAKLSSLELSVDEVKKYQSEVGSILAMIDKLKEIDTKGVEPTYQVSGNENITREDTIDIQTVAKDKLLKLAPETLNGQIKVKKVL
jgi:aspartyl-tRNA(Asn)/glutamyl-tRNA(Gln) amidotransferase subunit C